jgi:phospholipid transport system substrate-binding protein
MEGLHNMTLSRRILLAGAAAIAITMALPPPGPVAATPDAARGFITELGKETVAILQAQDPAPRKAARLEDVFRKGFDFPTIGRFVLGRHWNSASPQQREEFLKAFTDFVTKSYSRRLAEEATISGFNITNLRDLGENDYLVQTVITRPNAPSLNYEWRVRQGETGVKIVDIVVEGVSLLVTQRSDYTSAVQQNGLDGLTRTLREKAARGDPPPQVPR